MSVISITGTNKTLWKPEKKKGISNHMYLFPRLLDDIKN